MRWDCFWDTLPQMWMDLCTGNTRASFPAFGRSTTTWRALPGNSHVANAAQKYICSVTGKGIPWTG